MNVEGETIEVGQVHDALIVDGKFKCFMCMKLPKHQVKKNKTSFRSDFKRLISEAFFYKSILKLNLKTTVLVILRINKMVG